VTGDRLLFFGTDAFSAPALEGLIESGYDIVAVITKPDAATGRGRVITPPLVKTIAESRGIPVLQPTRLADIHHEIAALNPSAAVVVAYGKIIPSAIIDLFPKGLINVHASLLPKYRGSSPIEAAILNGDTETGVTIMRINEKMDAGDTYAESKIKLEGHETRLQLHQTLATLGALTLLETLPKILNGELKATPQNEEQATYIKMIHKTDGRIDWSQPALKIERQIRGYLGWPGSRASILGTDVTITAVAVIDQSQAAALPGQFAKDAHGDLIVTCGAGVLRIDRLKPDGKREMTGREFVAGRANLAP